MTIKQCCAAFGRDRAAVGAGHLGMAELPHSARTKSSAAARARPRHDRHRHRGDVCRWRRRGARRRGDPGRRDDVFLVSKVLPATRHPRRAPAACEASLRRLGTISLDLYLLHWRGTVPLDETARRHSRRSRQRKNPRTGASATSTSTTWRNWSADRRRAAVASNQVLYNLTRRGIEYDLLPWCRERGMPIMAYSPLEQGRLLGLSALTLSRPPAQRGDARRRSRARLRAARRPAVTRHPQGHRATPHVRDNRRGRPTSPSARTTWPLSTGRSPRRPRRKQPLEML